MKCRTGKIWACLLTVLPVCASSGLVEAQTDRALERRIERNERQMQRQANRVDYYSADTWQQLNPWIQHAGVAPFSSAATPARSVAAATGNAVKQTVDAASRIVDGQFGYQDKSPQSAWFYDYYTVSPTYYVPQGDDRYASAVRYFDRDGDGVFEAQSNYRDSDNDGRYDEYDQLDFYQSPAHDSSAAVNDNDKREDKLHSVYEGPEDSRRHRFAGEISMIKNAKVQGQENLVVALKSPDGATPAIDLGPIDGMQGKHVEVGTQIVANGALQQVGDKQVLIADTVQIGDGKPLGIDRNFGQNYTGEIVDIKTVQTDRAEYYMAVVNIDGEPQLVDLGPTTSYKVALKPSSKITIRGVPVRTRDHRVILAQQIELGKDNTIRIERPRQF
ncbi:MAG: hypothetical protein ABI557_03685 [Aureliella sp.]